MAGEGAERPRRPGPPREGGKSEPPRVPSPPPWTGEEAEAPVEPAPPPWMGEQAEAPVEPVPPPWTGEAEAPDVPPPPPWTGEEAKAPDVPSPPPWMGEEAEAPDVPSPPPWTGNEPGQPEPPGLVEAVPPPYVAHEPRAFEPVPEREPLQKVCGVHAVQAVYARRPADIQRVYLTAPRVPEFSALLQATAKMRRPYRIVEPDELERITDSRHHEGICAVVRPRAPVTLTDAMRAPGAGLILALVDVGNPHNVGALIRSAVNFGARAALFPTREALLPAATVRTAQGGAEWIDIIAEPDLSRVVRAARAAGFSLCATSSRGGRDLYAAPLPARMIVLVGAEDEGLPPAVTENADRIVSVPGTGHVESLNVSAAAAIVMAEHWHQHVKRPDPTAG